MNEMLQELEEMRGTECDLIAARIRKIRERMIVEAVSGVSATNKDVFLEVCQVYEQRQANKEISLDDELEKICGVGGQWETGGDEWSDWHKLLV